MKLYKYVTEAAALRYLKSRKLRVTPADQFNDPFEMRPRIALSKEQFLEQAPDMVVEQMMANGSFLDQLPPQHERYKKPLVEYLLRRLSSVDEASLLKELRQHGVSSEQFEHLASVREVFNTEYVQRMKIAENAVPHFLRAAQPTIHKALIGSIGVLCLCGSGNHPLMWAHYSASHTGALLEFDANAACFTRKRSEEDMCGSFKRVWYSDTRPALHALASIEQNIAALALTKSLDWAYEQEMRFLWPLQMADEIIKLDGAAIHLIDVPEDAFTGITLGCKATKGFGMQVIEVISTYKNPSRHALRMASIDDDTFGLNYVTLRT